jgi:hypothetical protein
MQLKSIFAATTLLTSAVAAPSLFTRKADWATWAWTIRDFTRNCTDPNICTYWFTIDTGNSTQACTIVDFAIPATTHPWYNIPCQQVRFHSPFSIFINFQFRLIIFHCKASDYHISWGWDYNGDFTVMTVVNETTQNEAFFGYSHPNDGLPVVTYPDVGPNAVQSTGVSPA